MQSLKKIAGDAGIVRPGDIERLRALSTRNEDDQSELSPVVGRIIGALFRRIQAFERALFRCTELSGADTSGGIPTSPDITDWTVSNVQEMRENWDEACEEIENLKKKVLEEQEFIGRIQIDVIMQERDALAEKVGKLERDRQKLMEFVQQIGPEENCNCITEHSWYGEGHCSACPVSVAEDLLNSLEIAEDDCHGPFMEHPGLKAVLNERLHQKAKGWTAEHDDCHEADELVWNAMDALQSYLAGPTNFPVEDELWGLGAKHNGDPRRLLVVAAALVVAEYERRLRQNSGDPVRPREPWLDDSIQFPRLIEEAQAAGAFTNEVLHDMADSMDLKIPEIQELLNRAMHRWEGIKDSVVKSKE